MPETLLLCKDVDMGKLTNYYKLSRGQIALVVKNAAVSVAGRNGRYRILFRSDLVKHSELDMVSSVEFASDSSIGFRKQWGNGADYYGNPKVERR